MEPGGSLKGASPRAAICTPAPAALSLAARARLRRKGRSGGRGRTAADRAGRGLLKGRPPPPPPPPTRPRPCQRPPHLGKLRTGRRLLYPREQVPWIPASRVASRWRNWLSALPSGKVARRSPPGSGVPA
ncbi:unnamed protein product [Rangifer tarandus platyrhynchus]|uniref:Uncharacterized protein n=2 Tax=Rangifer tarandus platyrhynchus TaxID=3082113 RepID=A0ACB0E4N8_RANTA|nr:unnamed protein product [Rangifer tarandus platyrhynchus]CAI9695441.1 unnamed protein product [Rangifer tarandus platyrhynchus]